MSSEKAPEEAIPDRPENRSAREFLRRAPSRGLWLPMGVEVKVMQCWRCKAFGHRTGDRECPLSTAGNLVLDAERQAREDPMARLVVGAARDDGNRSTVMADGRGGNGSTMEDPDVPPLTRRELKERKRAQLEQLLEEIRAEERERKKRKKARRRRRREQNGKEEQTLEHEVTKRKGGKHQWGRKKKTKRSKCDGSRASAASAEAPVIEPPSCGAAEPHAETPPKPQS